MYILRTVRKFVC